MRLLLLFILPAYLFLLSSCKKYQAADASFFINPGAITVSTNTTHEGSGSHKITDLWVYVNGKYQGTYPAGNLIPIPSKNQAATINVFAGIKNNGIADTRIFYPFYDFLTIDTLVAAGKTIDRGFTFKYKPSTTFTWTENFNSTVGISVKKSEGSDVNFEVATPENAFEGGSIKLSLSGSNVTAKIESSSDGFGLPTASSNVYLEINYKCNTPFTVGMMTGDGTQTSPAIVVNPQASWNKIYIQLSTAVNALITNKYKVYFEFTKDPSSSETKELFLDNIKLLYL